MPAMFWIPRSLSCAALVALLGCGDDGGPAVDAAPGEDTDADNRVFDATNGVVCAGALANYTGVLVNAGAVEDRQNLVFLADLDSESAPDRLRVSVANAVLQKEGTFELPNADWSVSIRLDDADSSCSDALAAFSGTLRVDNVDERFKANLDRVILVDSVADPTCSAALSQASFDVAIERFL